MYRFARSSLSPLSRGQRLIGSFRHIGGSVSLRPARRSPRSGRHYSVTSVNAADHGSSSQKHAIDTVSMQQLSTRDRHMVRLYVAGCFHRWELLPDIAREFIAAGCTAEELRGCVRHLIVFAGYAPCLAATLALHKAKALQAIVQLLPENTPAKFGGPPGNAFELVYDQVTDLVRKKMHAADPAVGEWIRLHLYGDIYSSPGLDLRQKQLLACSFLGVAHMPDQLFGHAIAALRFGNSKTELEEAIRLGFQMEPQCSDSYKDEAFKMLDMAHAKYKKDFSDQHSPPTITVPDPSTIKIPSLPPPHNAFDSPAPGSPALEQQEGEDAVVTVVARGGGGREDKRSSLDYTGGVGRISLTVDGAELHKGMEQEEEGEDVLFAWEEIDPRFDKASRAWRNPQSKSRRG